MSELTPLMKQYNDIKRNYPDAVVFFRLGYFYEMFGQDAVTASKILQITLTSRDRGKDSPTPMCGIPYFTSEAYISKLIKAGHRVAVCEQVEDPKDAKGIVRREVVKVFTPGTFIPENPKENNYILGFSQKENIFGLAVADIKTGEFLIYPISFKNNPSVINSLNGFYLTPYDDWYFDYLEAYRKLLKYFKVTSLEGYGCEGMVVAISAAGALLTYLEETQKHTTTFKKINVLRQESQMLLDAITQRNLEITKNMRDGEKEGSLLSVIDETVTPMGGRLLRSWLLHPLFDCEKIRQRQDAIGSLIEDAIKLSKIQNLLKEISDIERLTFKIGSGTANARDLLSLKNSLKILPELKNLFQGYDDERLQYLSKEIDVLSDIESVIGQAIADDPPFSLKDGGLIKKGFNQEIDELREISGSGKDFIASLQTKKRQRTGISSLKVGYNRIFGYYI